MAREVSLEDLFREEYRRLERDTRNRYNAVTAIVPYNFASLPQAEQTRIAQQLKERSDALNLDASRELTNQAQEAYKKVQNMMLRARQRELNEARRTQAIRRASGGKG